ncbi:MAG: hydrogenase maturation nickel metallochaperone HypA [Methylococcaceae bacterium]|nr:hydrogenase maturation nickel metallochaperone HypA [Methylococcaceae bacterium]
MHEISLCESVLQVLEQQAITQHFKKVKIVWLEIGALSSVEPEAMRFCFDAVMENSLADNAKLEIIYIAGQAWCVSCNKNVVIEQRYDECPDCGGLQLQINNGEQMRIKELEVE